MTAFDIALVGPTASGKSSLGMAVAQELGGIEIVSIDSMQVYRGMDIGTAKPTRRDQQAVPHHMIDLIDASEEMALASFVRRVGEVRKAIHERGNRALLLGGTGLYLQAVVDNFDIPGQYPQARAEAEKLSDRQLYERLTLLDGQSASKIEPDNRRRLLRAVEVCVGSGRPFSSFGPGVDVYDSVPNATMFGVWLPRDVNAERIEARIDEMLAGGWLEEVDRLHKGGDLSKTASQALGYKELKLVRDGQMSIEVAKAEIARRTKAFSRRQRVWFRRDPRIQWHATAREPHHLLRSLLEDCRDVDDWRGSKAQGGDCR